MLIKGLKEYKWETKIKIVHFTDNTTIFLRGITWLNRVQVILRLYENAKINYLKDIFKNPSLYGVVHIKIEFTTRKAGMVAISIKIIVKLILVNLFSITANGTKQLKV